MVGVLMHFPLLKIQTSISWKVQSRDMGVAWSPSSEWQVGFNKNKQIWKRKLWCMDLQWLHTRGIQGMGLIIKRHYPISKGEDSQNRTLAQLIRCKPSHHNQDLVKEIDNIHTSLNQNLNSSLESGTRQHLFSNRNNTALTSIYKVREQQITSQTLLVKCFLTKWSKITSFSYIISTTSYNITIL